MRWRFPFSRTYRLHHVYERMLGTEVELQVVARSQAQAQAAEQQALAEVARLTTIFNRFDAQSELRRWQLLPQERTPLSPELLEVLAQADHWRNLSGGAFHPGADALGTLWKAGEAAQQLPDPQELAALVAELRVAPWTLHGDGTATLHARSVLGLNALAKGFIVDAAATAASQAPGVQAVLVNAGGDLRTIGGAGLNVAIANPLSHRDDLPPIAQVPVRDSALATSGSAHRGYQINGKWYSHVLDPRTGQPVQQVPGVSVLAPTCTMADALATVLGVLPLAEARVLAETLPQVAALIVGQDGQQHATSGWPRPLHPH